MQVLSGSSGKAIGYIINNILVIPQRYEVVGVILGHCVFGAGGVAKGKFLKNTLYTTSGEILARVNGEQAGLTIDMQPIMHQAWQIINHIHDHNCSWIVPTEKWSAVGFADFLRSGMASPTTADRG